MPQYIVHVKVCMLLLTALFQGINLVQELMDEYGIDVVQAYMAHIQVTIIIHVLGKSKFCIPA